MLRPDSGGDGEYRGGLGAVYEIELLEENTDVFLFRRAGQASASGRLSAANQARSTGFTSNRDDGEHSPPMVSKMVGIHIMQGQKVRLETPGGGGYGDPESRNQNARAADCALGYVTEQTSK